MRWSKLALGRERGSQRSRGRTPTDRELALWESIRKDLQEFLYTGYTGKFQIDGHRQVGHWASPYTGNKKVLEIACGGGHHLRYSGNKYENYVGLDIRKPYLLSVRQEFPKTNVINADAYALPFRDASIDCVLSIYCFEHLRKLKYCLAEVRRILKPDGALLVGLPAEGGILYELGRRLTSKRYMERKYGIEYDVIVRWEHWNTFSEVIKTLKMQFDIIGCRFIPFAFFPTVHLNVVGCLRCRPKRKSGTS